MRQRALTRRAVLACLIAGLASSAAHATTDGTLRLLNLPEPVPRVVVANDPWLNPAGAITTISDRPVFGIAS